MRIRCAFLNCYNLFEPGTVDRGPVDEAALDAKIADLGDTLRAFRSAHVIGLCEIGTRGLAERVVARSSRKRYDVVWADPPRRNSTGLALAVRTDIGTIVRIATAPSARERPKWLAVLGTFGPRPGTPMWVVVNHWASKLGGPDREPERTASAGEVADFIAVESRSVESIILMGDFNAEPWEAPLQGAAAEGVTGGPVNRLVAMRERAAVIRGGWRTRVRMYGACWRLVGEPLPAERERTGDAPTRPLGTFRAKDSDPWQMLDQVLVSGRMLRGGSISLREGSIRLAPARNQASDHCALAFELELG
jgi:endonuclease/exonuclease/phosphatase family metal-dependent hydrolase